MKIVDCWWLRRRRARGVDCWWLRRRWRGVLFVGGYAAEGRGVFFPCSLSPLSLPLPLPRSGGVTATAASETSTRRRKLGYHLGSLKP